MEEVTPFQLNPFLKICVQGQLMLMLLITLFRLEYPDTQASMKRRVINLSKGH